MPETRLAVDTNFVLDLARQRDVAHDALEVIRRRIRGAQIVVVPTTLDELINKANNDPDSKQRECAGRALARMRREWGMVTVELGDLQNITARFIANKLLDQRVIPLKEHNDARILAEAAVLECQVLVSSDGHLREADAAQLAFALGECGVPTVIVRRPDEIVRMFAGR